MKIRTILSDNGRGYRGQRTSTPYELFLQLEDIEHRTTKVGGRSPTASSRGSTASASKNTLRIKVRTPWYETVEEMQKDLERILRPTTSAGPTTAAAW